MDGKRDVIQSYDSGRGLYSSVSDPHISRISDFDVLPKICMHMGCSDAVI